MKSGHLKRQKGAALLMAMTIIVALTVLVATITLERQISIRRTMNLVHGSQAHQFSLAAERLAIILLKRDLKEGKTDHLGEDWALPVFKFEVEEGDITGRIEDMQGRFNINNLVDEKGAVSQNDVDMLRRLFRVLEIKEDNVIAAVIDWLDQDINPTFPDGAEDGEYLGAQVPYRAANRPITSTSELYLVKGMTPQIYKKLAPFICALPKRTKINLNTASAEVISILHDGFNLESAKSLVEERDGDEKKEGFKNINEFLASKALADVKKKDKKLNEKLLKVSGFDSGYFLVASTATYGEGSMDLYSIVERDVKTTRVISRGQGGY